MFAVGVDGVPSYRPLPGTVFVDVLTDDSCNRQALLVSTYYSIVWLSLIASDRIQLGDDADEEERTPTPALYHGRNLVVLSPRMNINGG